MSTTTFQLAVLLLFPDRGVLAVIGNQLALFIFGAVDVVAIGVTEIAGSAISAWTGVQVRVVPSGQGGCLRMASLSLMPPPSTISTPSSRSK